MDNVSLVKNLYDAFGRGDIPTVLGAMSPPGGRQRRESVGSIMLANIWLQRTALRTVDEPGH
jgi:hypothetical protein